MNAIHAGEIKGLLSICFNPLISLPDSVTSRQEAPAPRAEEG